MVLCLMSNSVKWFLLWICLQSSIRDIETLAEGTTTLNTITTATETPDSYPLRLSGTGRTPNSGRLEIQIDGEWGTVCRDGFRNLSATVACRQLGYRGISGVVSPASNYNHPTMSAKLSDVVCYGGELRLYDCEHRLAGYGCRSRDKAVNIICLNETTTENIHYRLAAARSTSDTDSGRLEMQVGGIWGSICDRDFGMHDVMVACRSMGYGMAHGKIPTSWRQRGGSGQPIWLSSLHCVGSESNLMDCPHPGLGVHSCMKYHDVSIKCLEQSTARVPLRLVDGVTPHSGRLELKIDGKWGTVCREYFDVKDAKVACRNMGHRGFAGVIWVTQKRRTAPDVLLSSMACKGTESYLLDCDRNTIGHSYCGSRERAVIICTNQTKENFPLRLVGGVTPNSGRLEIKMDGRWGTVCNDGFDIKDAKVACRNMGYWGIAGITQISRWNRATGPIWLTNLRCNGSESFLLDCPYGGVKQQSCEHNKDVAIICTNHTTDTVPLRLANGITPNSGRLEIQLGETWGTICEDRFGEKDAEVACRNMGYWGISGIIGIPGRSKRSGPIWLDHLRCNGSESYLLDCSHRGVGLHDCQHSQDVAIVCTNHTRDYISIRLLDKVTPNSGRLEVKIDGVFGTICDAGFDINDANVACRDMGYSGADGISGVMGQMHAIQSVPTWLSSLNCNGTESSLSECPFEWIQNNTCSHKQDVAVRCLTKDADTFPLRLKDGKTKSSGRLEILEAGKWGTICNDDFDESDGYVACRDLGYWGPHRFIAVDVPPRPATVPIWLDDLRCTGKESHLMDCAHNGLGIHNCSHDQDIAIKCFEDNEVIARLTSGMTPNMGRLEIQIDGVWGTVCNDNFDEIDEKVACRMLGYNGPYSVMDQMDKLRTETVLSIWLDDLRCTGDESHLLDCPHNGIGINDCTHRDDVGLKCLDETQVFLRLADGTAPNMGRLEVQIDGVWGSVCNNGVHEKEARVACRVMGYNGTSIALARTYLPGPRESPIWLDNLRCNGTESSLLDCNWRPMGVNQCNHKNDIWIMCLISEQAPTVSLRLMDGTAPNMGRLEIEIDGIWGTVCDHNFDQRDAAVACRMLGYNGSSIALRNEGLQQGPNMSPILLDSLQCRGNESSLLDCVHSQIGSHNCNHGDDVWIMCINAEAQQTVSLRLMAGTAPNMGRLEIEIEGIWGTVCNHNFDQRDATVACRMLGYNGSSIALQNHGLQQGSNMSPILLDSLQCLGNESNLLDCVHSQIGTHNCDHGEDAWIMCINAEALPTDFVRLVNGQTPNSGRLEVQIGGIWIGFMDSGFDQKAATVVCGMLGHSDVVSIVAETPRMFVSNLYPKRLGSFQCNGSEPSLLDCFHTLQVDRRDYYGNTRDVSIMCLETVSARLTNGTTRNSGRLEIGLDGVWGTVCVSGFDQNAATVACRMLGYNNTASEFSATGTSGFKDTPIWLDGLECTGAESSLLECVHGRIGRHRCSHRDDITIKCLTLPSDG